MNDARRYRLNAAECLSAAKTCAPPYRGLTLDMASSWLALARQIEAEDKLIPIWSKADAAAFAAAIPRRISYSPLTPLPKWRALTVRQPTSSQPGRQPPVRSEARSLPAAL
jgi:hypothetical protein